MLKNFNFQKDALPIIDKEGLIDTNLLLSFSNKQSNNYIKSIANRIVSTVLIKDSIDNDIKFEIKDVWKLISESILIIPPNCTISSIGSQGFLSIPLYKFEKEKEKTSFEFIRLHIWHNDLLELIDKDTCDKFSIHTHSFFAQSWIICGKIVNDRFNVTVSKKVTDKSLFSIGYNKTLNEVNQHTSVAINEEIYANTDQISHELYMPGGKYEIKAGDFHRSSSETLDGLSATIFMFSGKLGLVDKSFVVGPSEIKTSEINRKMHIDPKEFLNNIDKQISK